MMQKFWKECSNIEKTLNFLEGYTVLIDFDDFTRKNAKYLSKDAKT